MTTITFNKQKHQYDVVNKVFRLNEKDVRFDTEYSVVNPATGQAKQFKFIESTGSEWDPNTKWIYKSDDGLSLEVSNDQAITEKRADVYLAHKLRN